jgi:hypothetical protein
MSSGGTFTVVLLIMLLFWFWSPLWLLLVIFSDLKTKVKLHPIPSHAWLPYLREERSVRCVVAEWLHVIIWRGERVRKVERWNGHHWAILTGAGACWGGTHCHVRFTGPRRESISSAALHRAVQHVDRWIFSWFESAQISKWSNGPRYVQRGTAQQRNRTRQGGGLAFPFGTILFKDLLNFYK